jgi:Uma2 family endonuclease
MQVERGDTIMATVTETLLTAEEYARLPENDRPSELVRGRVVEMNPPTPRDGQICVNIAYILRQFLETKELGRVVSNDSAVITERNPDSVRGADIAYYSYVKVPRGAFPAVYLDMPPELIFEVRSSTDRWKNVLAKVAEYLQAGVKVVCVLDDDPPTIYYYTPDQPERILEADAELVIPDVLPGFRVAIRRFFE